jgi:hypothetical protein
MRSSAIEVDVMRALDIDAILDMYEALAALQSGVAQVDSPLLATAR